MNFKFSAWFFIMRVSVKEGTDLECDGEHCMTFPDETIPKRCTGCCIVFYNSNFKYQEQICDRCYITLLGTTFDTKKITILWWNNCKHRVLTILKRYQAVLLVEKVKPQDKYGYVNIDNFKA